MKRRQFITLISGAAVAWPLAARAQQPAMPVVGFLNATEFDYRVAAFHQGLKEFDYTATTTIPIVFTTGTDPVTDGLVDALNRPNGNITGIGFLVASLRPKQIEMLHKVVPNASAVGYLVNPTDTSSAKTMGEAQAAADALGLRLVVANASSDSEFEGAFAALGQNQVDGLVVAGDAFFNNRRHHLVALAARYSIPTIYPYREYTVAGGLMSYGTSIAEAYRLAGTYAGRILKGEKPVDLPVQLSTRIELIVNLKTAKALGLEVPPSLFARADEVIE